MHEVPCQIHRKIKISSQRQNTFSILLLNWYHQKATVMAKRGSKWKRITLFHSLNNSISYRENTVQLTMSTDFFLFAWWQELHMWKSYHHWQPIQQLWKLEWVWEVLRLSLRVILWTQIRIKMLENFVTHLRHPPMGLGMFGQKCDGCD